MSDGGSGITGYEVTMDGNLMPDCTASPCMIPGLANGTTYQFIVTAVNEVGRTSAEPVSARPMASTPAVPTPVPTQSPWALALMGVLAGVLAWRRIVRSHAPTSS